MRGWVSVAVFGALLVTPVAWGQMRGGSAGARAGVGVRGSAVARGSMVANHPLGVLPGRGPFFFSGFHPPFAPGFPRRRGFFINGLWYPYGYYGYPYYPLYWDTSNSSADAYNQQAAQLQQQLAELSDEVERLRTERAEMSATPPPLPQRQAPPAEARGEAPAVPTTLVFRDGKIQQVQNYAITGHALWVFNQQRSRKIPLSDLDISATQKANEERGVSFHIPPAA